MNTPHSLRGVVGIALLVLCGNANAQIFRQHAKVKVTAPTRYDWGLAVTGVSPSESPEHLTPDYESTLQRFDMYAPVRPVGDDPLPVIVFISFRDTPFGWEQLGPTCVREGVIFVAPYGVGNSQSSARRIRITLDCLDEVGRRNRVDPDQIYLAGYSGGGYIAARIATMLPEFVGGVIASNMVVQPPATPWQRDRVANRLSVASIVGEKEPAGLHMNRVVFPFLKRMGVHASCQVLPRHGHNAPPAETFDAAYRFLKQGIPTRRDSAAERPALRISVETTRNKWAERSLQDAQKQLASADEMARTLGILREIRRRWPDLPQAAEAEALINRTRQQHPEQPWLDEEQTQKLNESRFLAGAYDSAATARAKLGKQDRAAFAISAIASYEFVAKSADDVQEVRRARERIEALRPFTSFLPTRK